MVTFQLIGRASTFRLVRCYMYLGEIPTVYGISLDGKQQTTARLVDVCNIQEKGV